MDLVYGSALWYASTKVNCHHLTERLAVQRPTLFIESVGGRRPRLHEWRRLGPRLLRSFRPLRRVGHQLWVYSPLPLPLYGRGAEMNSRWVGLQIKMLLAVRRWSADACWVFHPMGLGTAREVAARGVIYYCIDDYGSYPGVNSDVIRQMESAILREAGLAVATGEPLAGRLRQHAKRVEVLPNVADTELFGRDHPGAVRHSVLETIDSLPRPRIGYLGNLVRYKIDMELVCDIARRRPDWSVVLVGPRNQGDIRAVVDDTAVPPNVHFVGEVPHALAPAVIDRFDVCLLPSARHPIMEASFPLKFIEYLLRGRPVVARPLPALGAFREWYDEADTAEQFVTAIDRRVRTDTSGEARGRRAFAQSFGWTDRINHLLALRSDVLSGRREMTGAGGTPSRLRMNGSAVR